jgi:hypothetical protein
LIGFGYGLIARFRYLIFTIVIVASAIVIRASFSGSRPIVSSFRRKGFKSVFAA